MSKILIIILIIGILASSGVLIKDYTTQSTAADNLTSQIETDSKALERTLSQTQNINTEIKSLTRNITDIENAINSEKNLFPSKIDSNEIIRNILRLGEQCRLIVIPLNTQGWTKAQVGKHEYSLFKMSLKITGNQKPLVDFVKQLNSLYQTLIIETLSINKPTKENAADGVEAELKLAIYAK